MKFYYQFLFKALSGSHPIWYKVLILEALYILCTNRELIFNLYQQYDQDDICSNVITKLVEKLHYIIFKYKLDDKLHTLKLYGRTKKSFRIIK